MRICMIAPLPPPYGGIANWLLVTKKYIKRCKSDIILQIVDISPHKRITEGRKLVDRIFDGGINMLRQKRLLKKLIRENRPDVIHITTSGQFAIVRDLIFLIYAKKVQIPVAYHIHFGRIADIEKRNTIEWKLMRRAIQLADDIISIDQQTFDIVKQYKSEEKCFCIPNPFDIEECKEIKNDNKEQFIIFVGWVIQTKGIEELLQAWNSIQHEISDIKLYIVGPYNDKYKEILCRKYNCERIIFFGEVSHKETLKMIQKAQLLILPSHTEGFPNVILEAMALETPVIATDVGAVSRMLGNECGYVVPPKDLVKLALAIKECLISPDKNKEVAINAKKKLMDNYSAEIICKKYYDIWLSMKR